MSLDTEYSISHFSGLLNTLYLVGQLLERGWVETSRHLDVEQHGHLLLRNSLVTGLDV